MISLQKFATSRNEKADTIRKYINRHPEIAEHTIIENKNMMLKDAAVELLDEIYPLPAPVEVIEDKESRLQLIKMQQLVIQLQEKLTEQQSMIAKVEAQQLLLDKTEKENAEMKQKLDERENDLEKARNEITQKKIELAEKEKNVEQERKRADTAEQENAKFKKTIFGLYKRVE